MKKFPIIGVTVFEATVNKKRNIRYAGCNIDYKNAVLEAGGIPVLIPHDIPLNALSTLMERLDGLLITGGGDVNPNRYGHQPGPVKLRSVNIDRDNIELKLARDAVMQEMPLLAICRGHQVLNVALGGTLYQDIATELGPPIEHDGGKAGWDRDYIAHSVSVVEGSRLEELLGTTEVAVNSFHHQAVQTLGEGLQIVATSPDGVVEGIELPDHKFAVSVQWHPENITGVVTEMKGLFRGLIEAI